MADSEFEAFCKKIFPVIGVMLVVILVAEIIFGACISSEKRAMAANSEESTDSNTDSSGNTGETTSAAEQNQTSSEPIGSQSSVSTDEPEDFSDVILKKTEDAGQEYIDDMIFIGDSTTYALSYYGVVNENQVWTGYDDKNGKTNGTLSLYTNIDKINIYYPDDNVGITIAEAASRKKPKYIVITLGLNGGVGDYFEERQFKASYRKLINAIKDASPSTTVILQNIFPVASNIDPQKYTKLTNERIDTANVWVKELAREFGLKYLNSKECLVDSDGNLNISYQSGDGIHMLPNGLGVLLDYIRTHAYIG